MTDPGVPELVEGPKPQQKPFKLSLRGAQRRGNPRTKRHSSNWIAALRSQ